MGEWGKEVSGGKGGENRGRQKRKEEGGEGRGRETVRRLQFAVMSNIGEFFKAAW